MDLLVSGRLWGFLWILGKLKKGPGQGLDEENHGDWFLMISHRFRIWGREKNMTLKFSFKMAIAVHCGRNADGGLERGTENSSCLECPLNFASLENLTLAEGEWQHQEGELITKYLLISSRANKNCFTWPPSTPPYLLTRPHCPGGSVQSHLWSTEHGTWQIMGPK